MSSSNPPRVDLNLRVRGLQPSATLAINERSADLARAGGRVYRLGLGQSPFPVPESVVQALRDHAAEKDYLPVRGLPALREAVADYHAHVQGCEVAPDGVLIGPGSKELMFLLQLVYYGDILIPSPAWVSYAPQARIVGRQVEWLPTRRENEWRLTPDELALVCAADPDRPRILVLNYPSNPTGVTYGADQLAALAEVCRQYRVVVLSDEIYGLVDHDGDHHSIAPYYPEATIVSSGLSKWCGAGGWRLGTFAFPDGLRWLLDAMAAVASETYTSVSAPIQYAAVTAFLGNAEITDYLHRSRQVLRGLGPWCAAQLRAVGVDVVEPQGGFYLFPDFGPLRSWLEVSSSAQMVGKLLDDTGVAILAGSDFGRWPEELTARLAYVDFDGAAALEATKDLDADATPDEPWLRSWCAPVTEAIDRMCEWAS
ncbi:MAG: aminotransferase class I/II-fold pyridoxal phosphate-dependent enzyme [Acidimicrobiales bacterium]|nr:aminotransferase class I/II-fold pyridoxal phosphate-dependent enzyme [Acidimicrobiales bacterium]